MNSTPSPLSDDGNLLDPAALLGGGEEAFWAIPGPGFMDVFPRAFPEALLSPSRTMGVKEREGL